MYLSSLFSYSKKRSLFIRAILLKSQSRLRSLPCSFLNERGVLALLIVMSRNFSDPLLIKHSRKVRRCFSLLNPDTGLFGSDELGGRQYNSPNSSVFHTFLFAYVVIIVWSLGMCSLITSLSALLFSPCNRQKRIPRCFLKRSINLFENLTDILQSYGKLCTRKHEKLLDLYYNELAVQHDSFVVWCANKFEQCIRAVEQRLWDSV